MASIRLDNDFSPLSRSEREPHLCSCTNLEFMHEITYAFHVANLFIYFLTKCSHRALKIPPLACNITQVTSERFGSHCQHIILSAGIYVSVIHVLEEHIVPQLSSVNSKSEKNKRRRKLRRQKGDGQKQTASLCGHK